MDEGRRFVALENQRLERSRIGEESNSAASSLWWSAEAHSVADPRYVVVVEFFIFMSKSKSKSKKRREEEHQR